MVRTVLFALLLLVVAACDWPAGPATPSVPPVLTVLPDDFRLVAGQTAQLVPRVEGEVVAGGVTYATTDSGVARVTSGGLVAAVAPGVTTVRATWVRDPRATAVVAVQVVSPGPAMLSPAAAVLDVGQSVLLFFAPDGNAAVSFRSADTTVAVVSAAGIVTARAAGNAVILAVARDDSTQRATATITVRDAARPVLAVSPTSAVLYPNQQLLLVSTVSSGNAAVFFRAADTAVAVVSANGVVTARSTGASVVTVLLRADTTVRAYTSLTVVRPEADLAIAIGSITTAAGEPVDAGGVRGVISVRVEVTPGRADSLRVFVGDRVIPSCARALVGPAQQSRSFDCLIDTADFDTATGAVAFPNGRYPITALLVQGGQEILAAGATTALTFRNTDRFLGRLTLLGPTAADGEGRIWAAGSVQISAVPILYGRGGASAIAISIPGYYRGLPVTVTRTDQDASDGLMVTFPADALPAAGGVRNFNTGPGGSLPAVAGALVSTAGLPAMPFANEPDLFFRLDNEAPLAGTLVLANNGSGYVGAEYAFLSGYVPGDSTRTAPPAAAANPDAPYGVRGVDRVRVILFAAPATSVQNAARISEEEIQAIVLRNVQVRKGSDLPASATPAAYVLVAAVADSLGNTAYTALPEPFGVDPSPPILRVEAPSDTINPTAPFRFSATDSVSGSDRIRVFAFRVTSADERLCVDFDPAASSCDPALLDPAGGAFSLAALPPGYYTIEAEARDRAGNTSARYTSRLFLHDPRREDNAPTVAAIRLPAEGRGGQPVEFSADLRDNVDLATASMRFLFAGGAVGQPSSVLALPLARPVRISSFGAPIRDSATVRVNFPLLRALYAADPAGIPDAARFSPTSALQVEAADIAGNRASRQIPVSPEASNGLPSGIRSFVAGAVGDQRNLCVAVSGCGGVPSSAQVTAVVTGPSGAFTIPFDQVYFFYTDRTGALQLLGSGRTPVAFDNTTTLTWTYSASWNAAAAAELLSAPGGSTTIFAVGVDPQGDALLSSGYSLSVR